MSKITETMNNVVRTAANLLTSPPKPPQTLESRKVPPKK